MTAAVQAVTGRRAWLAAAGLVVAGAWLLAVGFRLARWSPSLIDLGWNRFMAAAYNPTGHAVAAAFAVIGTGVPAVLLLLLGTLLVAWRRGWGWALVVVIASSVSEVNVLLLKVTAARARPSRLFTVDTSFPSGHTTNAALLAVVLALLLRQAVVWVAAVGWVVAMAWSRTYLHAHWLSDVLVGALLGAATALLVVQVAARIARRRVAAGALPG